MTSVRRVRPSIISFLSMYSYCDPLATKAGFRSLFRTEPHANSMIYLNVRVHSQKQMLISTDFGERKGRNRLPLTYYAKLRLISTSTRCRLRCIAPNFQVHNHDDDDAAGRNSLVCHTNFFISFIAVLYLRLTLHGPVIYKGSNQNLKMWVTKSDSATQ